MEYIETRYRRFEIIFILSAKTGEGVIFAFEKLAKQCADLIQTENDFDNNVVL